MSDGKDIAVYKALVQHIQLAGKLIQVWDAAFEAALRENDVVLVPDRGENYYISRSIVLKSGKHLQADAGTVIRAVPGMITAMVRNATILPGNQYPEPQTIPADHDISISGGIWSAGIDGNPNHIGSYDREKSVTGMGGNFVFSNVRNLKISNLEVRDCGGFCIQLSNAENVEVSQITFRNGRADGLHMNGPLKHVYVHELTNEGTGDDFISLNAWDWVHSHVTAGAIEDVRIEHCLCNSSYSCIRLLAGEKHYFDNTVRECFISDVVFSDIHGVKNYKMYAQGFSGAQENVKVGTLHRIRFNGIYGLQKMNRIPFEPPYYGQGDRTAPFEILSNADELRFENLHGDFDFSENPVIIAVGPLAWTGCPEGCDPFLAKELFPVHLSCHVKQLVIDSVFDSRGNRAEHPEKLVCAFKLAENPAFIPGKDIARGGTGRGIVDTIEPL